MIVSTLFHLVTLWSVNSDFSRMLPFVLYFMTSFFFFSIFAVFLCIVNCLYLMCMVSFFQHKLSNHSDLNEIES